MAHPHHHALSSVKLRTWNGWRKNLTDIAWRGSQEAGINSMKDKASKADQEGSVHEPFLAAVPDFVLADWYMSMPRMDPRYGTGRPASGRPRIVGGLRWAIHLAVIAQRSAVVVLPDVLLGQVLWGGDRDTWPANWRRFLLDQLTEFSGGPGCLLVEVKLQEKGNERKSCPEVCPLHSRGIGHRHLTVTIRTEGDLDEEDRLDDEGQPDEDA
jgi:hypothetical protein